jgi:hypothetical protein
VTRTILQQLEPLNTMKIFHALVSYLIFTALPLGPLHPFAFAFASPVAGIHYDGYVDITHWQNHIDINGALMKHFLGILETVTVTSHAGSPSGYVNATQKHTGSDSAALMKRVPGDIMEPRQSPLIPLIPVILFIAGSVLYFLVTSVDGDDPVRGNDVGICGHSD